ncbi:ATP-dependent DNA helicase tlh1 [Ceratobasidium sp. AG-Ba]|nr:ATP-dependent DNA helicase tlh1 [Ceratobasidium sp. AG-Ba]
MGLPRVHWTNRFGTRMLLDGHVIKMDDLHIMVANLLQRSKEHLVSKVLKGLELEADISYTFGPDTAVIDDLSRTTPGHSFLTGPLNPFLGMTTLLAKAFLQHPKVKGHFHSGLDEENKPICIRRNISDWLREVEHATENICLLMFLLGGQSPRGTEFNVIKLVNITTRLRGIFWLDGWLMYLVTELFMILHALVRPLTVDWTFELYGEARARVQESTLMASEGTLITSDRMSHFLEQLTLEHTELAMGYRRWRHCGIAVMQRHLLIQEADEEGDVANSVFDMQAAHTTKLANALYALKTSEWHLMTSTAVAKFMDASQRSHDWMLIKIRGSASRIDAGEAQAISSMAQDPLVRQRSDDAVDAIASAEKRMAQSLADTEKRLAALMELSSQTTAEEMSELAAATTKVTAVGVEPPVQIGHPGEVHVRMLQTVLKDASASFKGNYQGVALATVSARQPHVLAVLATGLGKSVLFMGPASVEPMVTVVIAPLVALKLDIKQRALQAGVDCSEWRHGLLQDRGLVILSGETAGLETFWDWALLQYNQKKLARICIDEVHLLLTSAHYRPLLGLLAGIGTLGVPVLHMTATLPPVLKPHIKAAVGIQSMTVVRSPTQRPEIEIHAFTSQLSPGEVILVQRSSKEDAKKIAQKLGCPVLHADLSEAEKLAILQGWQLATYACVVATSAFGVGVHHPCCRVVLVLGSYGLLELDGQQCDNCQRELEWLNAQNQPLWRTPARAFPPAQLNKNPHQLVARIPRLPKVTSQRDKPAASTSGLSGEGQATPQPLSPVVAPALQPHFSPSSPPAMDLDPEEYLTFSTAKLRNAMSRLKDRCVFCNFNGRSDSHLIGECNSAPPPSIARGLSHLGNGSSVEETKSGLRKIPYGLGCYTCWYPVGRLHPKLVQGNVTCDRPDQLPQLAWLVHHTPQVQRRFQEYFGTKFSKPLEMFEWCQTESMQERGSINVHILLVWYMERIKGLSLVG